jgi:hypothetical protein
MKNQVKSGGSKGQSAVIDSVLSGAGLKNEHLMSKRPEAKRHFRESF